MIIVDDFCEILCYNIQITLEAINGEDMKQISVEIIHRCPNKCIHCSSFSSPLCQDVIPEEVVFEIIDGAKRLETEVLSISGGEPFLHKDLVSIVEYAKKQELAVYVYSSGIVLNGSGQVGSLSRETLSELKRINVDKIIFDLPAVHENVYDNFMGTKGQLGYALESISRAKDQGIFTEIHFVPTKINIDEIDGIIAYAKAENLDRVSFLGLVPHGRAKENAAQLYLSPEETAELKKKLYLLRSELIRIGIPLQLKEEEYQCYAGCGKLCVRYDGKVFGCEAFKYIDLYDDNRRLIEPDSVYERKIDDIYYDSAYLIAEKKFISQSMSMCGCSDKCPVQRMYRIAV